MRNQIVLVTAEELGKLKNLREHLDEAYHEMHYANSKAGVVDCVLCLGLKDGYKLIFKEEVNPDQEYTIKGKDILKVLEVRDELIHHTSNARGIFGTILRQLFMDTTKSDFVSQE